MNLTDKTSLLNQVIETDYQYQAEKSINYRQQYHKLLLLRRSSEFIFVVLVQTIGLFFDFLAKDSGIIAFGAAMNLVLVFARGYRIWPGLWAGAFLVWLYYGATLSQALALASLNALQPLLLVFLIHHVIGALIPFAKRADWFCYVLLAAVTCLIIQFGYQQLITIPIGLYSFNAFMLIVPANLIWAGYPFIHKIIAKSQWLEIAGLLSLLIAVYLTGLIMGTAVGHFCALINLLITAFIANRYGLLGAALSLSLLALTTILLALSQSIFSLATPNPYFMTMWFLLMANFSFYFAIGRAQRRGFKTT